MVSSLLSGIFSKNRPYFFVATKIRKFKPEYMGTMQGLSQDSLQGGSNSEVEYLGNPRVLPYSQFLDKMMHTQNVLDYSVYKLYKQQCEIAS